MKKFFIACGDDEPMIDEESGMSSLDDALEMERDICKKL